MKKYIDKIKSYYRNYNKRNYKDAIDDVITIIDDDSKNFTIEEIRDLIATFSGVDQARDVNEISLDIIEKYKELGEIMKTKINKYFDTTIDKEAARAIELINKSIKKYDDD